VCRYAGAWRWAERWSALLPPDLGESCLRFGQDTYNSGGYGREPSRVGVGDRSARPAR
jgi:hypothetical protein